MRKILAVIMTVALFGASCGQKTEVPKNIKIEGSLLQATWTLIVSNLSIDLMEGRQILKLDNSFDIDVVGETTTVLDVNPITLTFPENEILSDIINNDLMKTKNDQEWIEVQKNKADELSKQTEAVMPKYNDDQRDFARYCVLETIKTIIDGKNFDRVARTYQGKEYESAESRKALVPRAYRYLPVYLFELSGEKVIKAKIDVMVDDKKMNGNGEYYGDVLEIIMETYRDYKNKAQNGPYASFVK